MWLNSRKLDWPAKCRHQPMLLDMEYFYNLFSLENSAWISPKFLARFHVNRWRTHWDTGNYLKTSQNGKNPLAPSVLFLAVKWTHVITSGLTPSFFSSSNSTTSILQLSLIVTVRVDDSRRFSRRFWHRFWIFFSSDLGENCSESALN